MHLNAESLKLLYANCSFVFTLVMSVFIVVLCTYVDMKVFSWVQAYFPHISQPEGLPLRVQDVKGKEWVFQYRFWPNNNSRMYVLEGVSTYIQSMQLLAGDKGMIRRYIYILYM